MRAADDFGLPVTAFLICRFWLIDAWWSLGRREEARELFVDALAHRNRYGLLSEDIDPQTGALVGQFPADLFDGRPDPDRDAAVAKLGGPLLARLVVVSNRVAVPSRDGNQSRRPRGCRAVVAQAQRGGLWFGWSGTVAAKGDVHHARTIHQASSYVTTDLARADYQEYYNGFANRMLWPILHYRLDLAEFSRRDLSGYLRVNEHVRRPSCTSLCSPTTSSGCTTIICCRSPRRCASAVTDNDRLLPAYPVSAARSCSPRCPSMSG